MTKRNIFLMLLTFVITLSCENRLNEQEPIITVGDEIIIHPSQIINDSYIGNGAQWDAYPQAYFNWNSPISNADWQKMFTRLDYMRPKLMRVTIDSGWKYAANGGYQPELGIEPLAKILQYCTDNNIVVMFGDWGGKMVNPSNGTIHQTNLRNAARYADYLINTRGFTCIKYYNMINEPNGNWSSTAGNYDLWLNATNYFYSQLQSLGLTSKLQLVAPDIAVWDNNYLAWISNTERDLKDKVALYDIHTYPGQNFVRDKLYSNLLKSYADRVPAGKKIVLSELGFKYSPSGDTKLYNENITRSNAEAFASNEDSNMFVKDFFYGVDMADATMQIVNAGYSGTVSWMLDDAMHNTNGDSGKDLKVWGFWNILGEEIFGGAQEEEIRPWFYTSSLLSRYMQTGAKVHKVTIPGKRGLNAITVTQGDKTMIAIVNTGYPDYKIKLKSDTPLTISNAKKFVYENLNRPVDQNGLPVPSETNVTLDLGTGMDMTIKGQSFVLFTNFDY